ELAKTPIFHFTGGRPRAGDPILVDEPDFYGTSLLMPDGDVLIYASKSGQTYLRRYRPNGRPDYAFADRGAARIAGPWYQSFWGELAFGDDGRIFVPHAHSSYGVGIVAVTPAGVVDDAFGDHGLALLPNLGKDEIRPV